MGGKFYFAVITAGIIVSLTGVNCTANETVQSSTSNHNVSTLGFDGDPTTCARTGFDRGAWWKVDLGLSRYILAVDVIGSTVLQTEIRIGDGTELYGARKGFLNNALCRYLPEGMSIWGQSVLCISDRKGRFVSFMIDDPFYVEQLSICEIIPIYKYENTIY